MNEDALNEVFNLSLDAGYTKDLDAFRELMANNEEARAEAFDLSVKAGYTKDINTFTELVGGVPGKVNVQGAGATVDGNQAPDTASALEGGSLESPTLEEWMATYSTEKLDTPAEVEPPKIADETEATRSESTLPSDATPSLYP